jgi:hypothetical protein
MEHLTEIFTTYLNNIDINLLPVNDINAESIQSFYHRHRKTPQEMHMFLLIWGENITTETIIMDHIRRCHGVNATMRPDRFINFEEEFYRPDLILKNFIQHNLDLYSRARINYITTTGNLF